MAKLNYLLQYLSELTKQLSIVNRSKEAASLWVRIEKINDLIETELSIQMAGNKNIN
jgi:hypothetical protein